MHGLVGEVKLIRRRGFTLIELLIVMIIVSLAMSTVAPSVNRGYEQQQVMLELSRFKKLLESLFDEGFYSSNCLDYDFGER